MALSTPSTGSKAVVAPMARRLQRNAPTQKRRITLAMHVWEALDLIVELQTEAYREMGGEGAYAVSDLLEEAAEMYIRAIIDELGPLPRSPEERRGFVKRLAVANQRALREHLLSKQ